MEQTRRGRHNGIPLLRLLLIAHAKIAAGPLQIHHVVVFRACLGLGRRIVELEARIFLQNAPIALFFQFIDDVVGRRCDDQRRVELDLAVRLLEIAEHLSDDFHVALMDHAGTDEAEIDLLLRVIVRDRANRVVGITLRWINVLDIRVGDHRLVNFV